jgi:PAS domain S-box-containing protein
VIFLAESETRYQTLIGVSKEVLSEKTIGGLLQCIVDAARTLTGARLGVAGHGYQDGRFRIGAASRAEDMAACPPGELFNIQKGGVYLDLIQEVPSLRLTDEQLRTHPAWWGLPDGHRTLHGLLGARLVGRDDRASGLIMVSDRAEGDFTAEDEALLVQLAALASLGMQQIQAREETERHSDELRSALDHAHQHGAEIEALLAGTRAVLVHRRFADAARAIFDVCKSLLGAKAGYVALSSADGTENDLVFLDAGGLPCTVDPSLPMPIRGLRAQAYQSGRVVYDNSFAQSEWTAFLPEGHVVINNVLFAPLVVEERVVGLLGLAGKPGGFDDNDARLAAAFGEATAVALVNSRNLDLLRDSEEKLEALFDVLPIGVSVLDRQHNVVRSNPALASMLDLPQAGLEHGSYKKRTYVRTDGTEMPPREFASSRAAAEQKPIRDAETGIIKEDGELIWTSVSAAPLPFPDWSTVIATVDITVRKRAEEALRQAHDELEERVEERTTDLRASEEQFRQLAENIREVFWITDVAAGRTLYVSPAYEEMTGYPIQELYADRYSFLAIVHPDDRERVAAAMRDPGPAGYDLEYRIVRPDGSPRWVRTRTFPIRNEQGQIYRYVGIGEDITDRVEAYQLLEQRVAERTRELATLLDISREVAVTLDLEPLLDLLLERLRAAIACDGAAIFKLEGDTLVAVAYDGPLPQEQVRQLHFPLERHPVRRRVVADQIAVIIPDLQSDAHMAQVLRHTTGNLFEPIYSSLRSWIGVPLAIQDRVTGMLEMHYAEVTPADPRQVDLALAFASQAAVAMENARLYQQAQALAAFEERQRLARDLHDAVSQTLFSAGLIAEVLPRLWERDPVEGQRSLAELHLLTRGALAEMRTLLLELRPAALLEVGLADLLRQLAEAVSGRSRLPITISADKSAPLPPDPQVNLYRIAQEALSNVAKHSGASHAAVSLRYQSDADGRVPASGGVPMAPLELSIADDGCGFDLAAVPPDSLGLDIMRERAEAIGARLTIHSQIGQGTRVTVLWPGE